MVERQKDLHAVKGVVCLKFQPIRETSPCCRTRRKAWDSASKDPASGDALGSRQKDAAWNSSAMFASDKALSRDWAEQATLRWWLLRGGRCGSVLIRLKLDFSCFLNLHPDKQYFLLVNELIATVANLQEDLATLQATHPASIIQWSARSYQRGPQPIRKCKRRKCSDSRAIRSVGSHYVTLLVLTYNISK